MVFNFRDLLKENFAYASTTENTFIDLWIALLQCTLFLKISSQIQILGMVLTRIFRLYPFGMHNVIYSKYTFFESRKKGIHILGVLNMCINFMLCVRDNDNTKGEFFTYFQKS